MKARGFSLVELIITLVILGTLSVTVLPKFFGPSIFDSYTARDQGLSILRTMQLRAMQNTGAACHKIIITPVLMAPPAVDTCTNTADSNNADYLVLALDANRTDVRFSTLDTNNTSFSVIEFDSLGRTNGVPNCANTCRIEMGEADICINVEGAIYGCE
ncbi:MSHA pilin protein MshC [Pseudoalteromonas ulvae UL12]|uniref:Agglutinin biogenesis protein MshC n=1 Tax=Pseudoalteromonas ulvae TaxID=107327 RepID=A0A244CQL4_PSEDV|nr:type II secretion system protein [Pseudoalteromonas ulvae]MBE0364909.1 MSHA pilin protein MshC [Pseudoalteromonas ulvae UL12]OUL57479.1 agglutinin biogenesis protein MshC [Pseudoalteromonas ulvae]